MTTLPPLPQVTISNEERIERRRGILQEILTTLAIVVGWFTAAGAIGALVWVNVTTLPGYTRVAEGGSMDEVQMAKQFAINGWFLVIAVAGGLISGVALLLIRRRSPVVTVVLVALGGGLATWLMLQCGLSWGPGDPKVALASAQLGDLVRIQLKPDARAVYFAWSIGALVGSAVAIWLLESRETSRARALAFAPGSAYPVQAPESVG